MLIHPTAERLRALGLAAMADALVELQNAPDAAALTREDWLGLLVDREATSRENKRLVRRLRAASTALSSRSSPVASGFATITIWWSSGRPESASLGWPAPVATRPAARASRCSTNAPPACSAT